MHEGCLRSEAQGRATGRDAAARADGEEMEAALGGRGGTGEDCVDRVAVIGDERDDRLQHAEEVRQLGFVAVAARGWAEPRADDARHVRARMCMCAGVSAYFRACTCVYVPCVGE